MKALIIKLGALGDVVRTLPILKALKKIEPNSEIHWLTKEESKEILETQKDIKKVHIMPEEIKESFNSLYNFDIEKEAIEAAKKINAQKKYGFSSDSEFPISFNIGAEYYLNTLFDDSLKKENKKTYQQMMFDAAELEYNKEIGEIFLTQEDKEYAENFIRDNKIEKENLIGFHIGASSRWPSKVWAIEKIKEFIIKAKKERYEILLFGGPKETDKLDQIVSEMKSKGIIIYKNNPNNTLRQFASLVNQCKKIISSDSFALHIALALKKPTIGLFFCTSPQEVEDYGILKKIVSPLLKDYFPEKMNEYNEELINSIFTEEVLEALKK